MNLKLPELNYIAKWILIIFVVAILFYFLYPKYYFIERNDRLKYRCNKITGKCQELKYPGGFKNI